MTMVFDRYPAGGNERLLALAMADHARDDGTRIWPSIGELAHKTLQSRRTVQRQIAKMVESGWLEPVRSASGRRGDTNEYRICSGWIDGGPLPAWGVKLTPHGADPATPPECAQPVDKVIHTGVTSDASGVTAMTPESSGTINNRNTPLPPEGGVRCGFLEFMDAYPLKVDHDKARRRWRRLKPDAALQQRMLDAIAAQAATPRWQAEAGRFIPSPARWLRDGLWQNEVDGAVLARWWESADGVRAMGARLGQPYTLDALGNAYTDDAKAQHWRAYRASVFVAAGAGPWAEKRAA